MKTKLIILVFLFLFSCQDSTGPVEQKEFNIKYQVSGAAQQIDVTYLDNGGITKKEYQIKLPFEKLIMANKGDYVFIMVQIINATKPIEIKIVKDDSLFVSAKNKLSNETILVGGIVR